MKSPVHILAIFFVLVGGVTSLGQGVSNVFDINSGANTYQGGVGDNFWVSSNVVPVTPNAGSQLFATANDSDNEFLGLGLSKDLGGTILDQPYAISFDVTFYGGDLTSVTFADFSTLRIGGALGSVVWTDTPTPTVAGQWIPWSGTYTPDPSDVGQSFTFDAVWDDHARRSLAIDGPVTALPSPEPTSGLLVATGGMALGAFRRRGIASCARF